MPEFPPGTPSWVDLGSPDPDASAAFYGGLFGWEAGEPMQAGGYRMLTLGGRAVAGLYGMPGGERPPAWTSYVGVADADAVVERVRAAGGQVVEEPVDIMDLGRMAAFEDPAGAFLGVWQPRAFVGADVVKAPGSLVWNEVLTTDLEGAKAFYPAVFGWEPGPGPEEMPDAYVVWMLGGEPVGGAMQIGGQMPPGTRPQWGVCFAVADADAAAARAAELGGTVEVPPTTMSVGRFAALRDPHGAGFSIMEVAEAPSPS